MPSDLGGTPTAQGKYLHDFFIIEIGDVFYIDCEAARLMDLGSGSADLSFVEIDLGIAEDYGVWALYGNDAGAAMGLDVQPGRGGVERRRCLLRSAQRRPVAARFCRKPVQ